MKLRERGRSRWGGEEKASKLYHFGYNGWRRLTRERAAELLGLKEPRVSAMLNGRFQGISERRLLDCLTRLGREWKSSSKPRLEAVQMAACLCWLHNRSLCAACAFYPLQVLPFQSIRREVLGLQISVDLNLVGVVVSESGMNLRQRKLPSERLHNFFGNLAHVLSPGNTAHRERQYLHGMQTKQLNSSWNSP